MNDGQPNNIEQILWYEADLLVRSGWRVRTDTSTLLSSTRPDHLSQTAPRAHGTAAAGRATVLPASPQ